MINQIIVDSGYGETPMFPVFAFDPETRWAFYVVDDSGKKQGFIKDFDYMAFVDFASSYADELTMKDLRELGDVEHLMNCYYLEWMEQSCKDNLENWIAIFYQQISKGVMIENL